MAGPGVWVERGLRGGGGTGRGTTKVVNQVRSGGVVGVSGRRREGAILLDRSWVTAEAARLGRRVSVSVSGSLGGRGATGAGEGS